MMSATVCGLASALSPSAGAGFALATWASADASCRAAAALMRAVFTASAALLLADLVSDDDLLSEVLLSEDVLVAVATTGAGFASASSSSSDALSSDALLSEALPLNKAANRLNLPELPESSAVSRFSMSARASSYPFSGAPSEGMCTVRPSGNTLAS